MSKSKHNILQLIYQESDPYLYGSIRVAKGILDNQPTSFIPFSSPFIISKTLRGREIIYGSVLESINKINEIVSRYKAQQRNAIEKDGSPAPESQHRVEHDVCVVNLPKSERTEFFLHDREREAEDAILLTSIHLRTLVDTFSGKFDNRIGLYDYENLLIGNVSIKKIYNTLLHHRYFVVNEGHIIDLSSHKLSLGSEKPFGCKVKIYDFLTGVIDIIKGITVRDYVGMLQSRLNQLSVESAPNDIMFAIQNVHSIGKIIRDRIKDDRTNTLLYSLFSYVVEKRVGDITKLAPGTKVELPIQFTAPSFKIEEDLSNLRIEIHTKINGREEILKIKCKEFLQKIAKAYGKDTLLSAENRKGSVG